MEAGGSRLIRYRDETAEFSIFDVSDVHWGNIGCDRDQLARDLARIADDPLAMFLIGGDYADWISIGDKRFDPDCLPEDFKARDLARFGEVVGEQIADLFRPVAGKCIGACYGNHEHKYMTVHAQAELHEALCAELAVANLRYSGWVDLYFEHAPRLRVPAALNKLPADDEVGRPGQRRLRVFIHHGFGGAATVGGKAMAIKRMVDMLADADLCFMGHLHDEIAKRFIRLSVDARCHSITQRQTLAVMTGGYLRTHRHGVTGYGEQRGYAPTPLGASRARYLPAIGRLTAENAADGVGDVF